MVVLGKLYEFWTGLNRLSHGFFSAHDPDPKLTFIAHLECRPSIKQVALHPEPQN